MKTTRRLPIGSRPATARALLGLCVVLLSAPTLSGCDRLLSAERRIERAAEAYAAGQYGAAMRDVKTALEAEPGNVAGRVLLARVSLRLGDAETARKELDRAIAAGAPEGELRDLHYDIFIAQGRFQDALIGAAVDDQLEPLRRLIIMATAQTALGQHEEAEETLDAARALDPASRELQLLQARALWARGQLSAAGTLLDAVIARDAGDAEAWLYKGRFMLGAGDAAGAYVAFAEAHKTAEARLALQEQLAVHVGLVESQMAMGDLAAAQTELRGLEAKAANAFVTRYLRARLAYTRGDYRAAVGELQRALNQQPGNGPARLLLGAALLGQGSTELAEAELARLVADQPDNIEARKLLARLYLSRNDTSAARRVLANDTAAEVSDAGVDWLTGSVMLLSGQTAEGIATLEQAVAAQPENVPLRLDLARGYLMAGRRAEALAVLEAIPMGEGGQRRGQLMVLAEVAGQPPAAARQAVARIVRDNPRDAELLVVAGSYLLSVSDTTAAIDAFERAVAAAPRSTDAILGLAAAVLQAGDGDRGERELNKAIGINPAVERAYIGLAGIALVRGDRAAARQALERAVSADPAAVDARLQLAELALADKDLARMNALAGQALEVTRARAPTLNRIGQLQMRASQYDEALARFNEAANLGSDEAEVNAALALVAMGRTDEGRARLEAAAGKRGDWAAPVAFLAALDSGELRFDRALARVAAFERAGGAALAAEEIRGDIQMASGQPAEAAASYGRAAGLQPSSGLALKRFRAERAAGNAAPQSSLTGWLETRPADAMVRVVLAEYYHMSGDRKAAIAEYEKALAAGRNPAVMNNLAWVYHEVGDERAAGLARQAHAAAPDNAEIADTYGWILVEQGRVTEGLPILQKAAQAAPAHPEIQYHYAAALAQAGRKDEAARALRVLLEAVPAFPSRREAEALLQTLARG